MMKKVLGVMVSLCLCLSLFFTTKASSEVDTAVSWLYQNGITKYTNATTFKSNSTIRRDEASKLFSVFAKTILQRPNVAISQTCTNFSDLPANNTMKSYVFDACTRGYILGSNNKFSPFASLSNAQAVAIIIRMIEGKKDESGTPRAGEYYKRAQELGLLSGLNLIKTTAPITRGKLGILLYRTSQLSDLSSLIVANNNTVISSTQPDLIINSVSLDTTYPSPKVGDEAPYITATIKNIGGPITFSSTNKMVFSCGYAIKKEITNGTLGENQSMTIEGVTNLPGTYPNIFPEAKDNYTINCNVRLQSSTVYESNENNNNKGFSVSVGATNQSTTYNGSDLIINKLVMNQDANGYRYHTFTIKNIGNTPYTFTSTDNASCSYSGYSTAQIKLNIQGTINQNETRSFSSSIEQSSKFIQRGDYTGSCFLYTNDDNGWNNQFTFRGSDHYGFLNSTPKNNPSQLPDLVIQNVSGISIIGEEFKYNLMITIKNIGVGTAYINQSDTLEVVCSGPSSGGDTNPVASNKIITNESVFDGGIFVITIPTTAFKLNYCYLYYNGSELSKSNNSLDFPNITYQSVNNGY